MNPSPYVTQTIPGSEAPARLRALPPLLPTDAEIEEMRRKATARRPRGEARRDALSGRSEHPISLENRLRVLHTATVLWAEHGIGEHSVRGLANAAGVCMATVHNQVGNRREMLAEILVTHVIALHQRVRTAADAAADAGAGAGAGAEATQAARLEALLLAYLEGVAAAPHAHFLLQHGLGSLAPDGRDDVRRRYRILLELLGEPLMQFAPSTDAKLAAALALAAVGAAGAALLWFDPKHELEVPATARRLTAMLLAAVRSEPEPGPWPGCGGPVQACAQAWVAGGAE